MLVREVIVPSKDTSPKDTMFPEEKSEAYDNTASPRSTHRYLLVGDGARVIY